MIGGDVERHGKNGTGVCNIQRQIQTVYTHTTMQGEDDSPLPSSVEATKLSRRLTEALIHLNQAGQ